MAKCCLACRCLWACTPRRRRPPAACARGWGPTAPPRPLPSWRRSAATGAPTPNPSRPLQPARGRLSTPRARSGALAARLQATRAQEARLQAGLAVLAGAGASVSALAAACQAGAAAVAAAAAAGQALLVRIVQDKRAADQREREARPGPHCRTMACCLLACALVQRVC
jgi:hypothetical protein